MNGLGMWLIVLAAGLVTLAIRAAFLVMPPGVRVPAWILDALRYVGAAVLPALVVPAVLFQDLQAADSVNLLRVVAALSALAVAVVTRSVFATMGAGMGVLWLLKWWSGAL